MDQFKSSPLAQETAWLDMLGLVDLDSLADRARFDELFDVSPHAWQNIPIPGHLDGLLLASMSVFFIQCFYHCLSKSWRQKEDKMAGHFWRFSSTQKSQQPSPFSGQEKSWVDANLSKAASV